MFRVSLCRTCPCQLAVNDLQCECRTSKVPYVLVPAAGPRESIYGGRSTKLGRVRFLASADVKPCPHSAISLLMFCKLGGNLTALVRNASGVVSDICQLPAREEPLNTAAAILLPSSQQSQYSLHPALVAPPEDYQEPLLYRLSIGNARTRKGTGVCVVSVRWLVDFTSVVLHGQ